MILRIAPLFQQYNYEIPAFRVPKIQWLFIHLPATPTDPTQQ